MHARNRAVGRASFFRKKFAANVVARITGQRHARIPALLRAVMHQPVFANIEISRTGAASPLVGQALRNVVLKSVDARKAALLPRLHLVINAPLFLAQRLHLPAAIVYDADGRTESQRNRALANSQRILWITDSR